MEHGHEREEQGGCRGSGGGKTSPVESRNRPTVSMMSRGWPLARSDCVQRPHYAKGLSNWPVAEAARNEHMERML